MARPEGTQNLCLEGYDNLATGPLLPSSTVRTALGRRSWTDGERRPFPPAGGLERTLSWLSKCRAILVRYDKKASNYVGLIQLACALLWYRRQHRLLF